MPATETAVVIALLFAPGFLMVRGYGRRRHRRVPERDVYAVSEALVASAIWLAFAWLVIRIFGEPLSEWGILPHDSERLAKHEVHAILLGFGLLVIPYWIGMLSALVVDKIGVSENFRPIRKLLRKWGLLKTSTAWDQAWLSVFRRDESARVVVQLCDGSYIAGGYGKGGQVDLSPLPHKLYLPRIYAYAEAGFPGGVGELLQGGNLANKYPPPLFQPVPDENSTGVFVDGDQIRALYVVLDS
jgi:hypothetical protein